MLPRMAGWIAKDACTSDGDVLRLGPRRVVPSWRPMPPSTFEIAARVVLVVIAEFVWMRGGLSCGTPGRRTRGRPSCNYERVIHPGKYCITTTTGVADDPMPACAPCFRSRQPRSVVLQARGARYDIGPFL